MYKILIFIFFVRLLCVYINSGARELGNTHAKLQNLINQKSNIFKVKAILLCHLGGKTNKQKIQ